MVRAMINPDSSQQVRGLVYGHAELHDCLAFADAATAAEEAAEIQAIAAAKTWGEARSVTTRHISNPAEADPHDDPDDLPADDEVFELNEVGSVVDGDWPPMVTTRAFDLLPDDLQTEYGNAVMTAVNGVFLEIPAEREGELVAELRARGYTVTRDDVLINVLDGRSFNPMA